VNASHWLICRSLFASSSLPWAPMFGVRWLQVCTRLGCAVPSGAACGSGCWVAMNGTALSTYPGPYSGQGPAAVLPDAPPTTLLCAKGFDSSGLLRIQSR